jgi:xanthine dehydrogenase accessory factor
MSRPLLVPRDISPLGTGDWLAPLSGHWMEAANSYLAKYTAVVRVTVAALRGSSPREAGASMLVGMKTLAGTIGGGQLEWCAIRAARDLLRDRGAAAVRIDDLVLGPDLGQCCGGRVTLWLERLTRADQPWLREATRRLREQRAITIATDFSGGVVAHRLLESPTDAAADAADVIMHRSAMGHVRLLEVVKPQRAPLWIFGAGHVGQSLIRLLLQLDLFEVTWIDSRSGLLPAALPDCVNTQLCASPVALLDSAKPGTHYVVLTHDHALDYDLCRSILRRGDARWLGLIGSASKSARFRSRLRRDGVSAEQLGQLHCPIGIEGISSKLPGAIAIAIVAQLLQQQGADLSAHSPEPHACGAQCDSCGRQGRKTE